MENKYKKAFREMSNKRTASFRKSHYNKVYCAGCEAENVSSKGYDTKGGKQFKHTCNKLKTKQIDTTKITKFNQKKHFKNK